MDHELNHECCVIIGPWLLCDEWYCEYSILHHMDRVIYRMWYDVTNIMITLSDNGQNQSTNGLALIQNVSNGRYPGLHYRRYPEHVTTKLDVEVTWWWWYNTIWYDSNNKVSVRPSVRPSVRLSVCQRACIHLRVCVCVCGRVFVWAFVWSNTKVAYNITQ